MKIKKAFGPVFVLLACSAFAGCNKQADTDAAASPSQAASTAVAERTPVVPTAVVCNSCGVVRSVTAVAQEGQATGAGAVIGGIVGGVAGNQVGGGTGKKIATVVGVIGGTVLGNEVEQNRNTEAWYEIAIDMEGGDLQIITVENPYNLGPGSRVSVQGSNITLL